MKDKVLSAIADATEIVVIQAENPDTDSLASSLALEALLLDQNKVVHLYCPVAIPKYLRYLPGWDRVENILPRTFDAAVIVDASTEPLLERVLAVGQRHRFEKLPLIVLDHHDHNSALQLQTLDYIDSNAVAAGEVVYDLAQSAQWPIPSDAYKFIAAAIITDSSNLTSPKTSAHSVDILADCLRQGVRLDELDDRRREYAKKSLDIFHYKAQLMQRVEMCLNNQLALIHIPWEEIEKYSDAFNPSMLVIDEMRSIENVIVAAAFKTYPDGKVTCKLRANPGGRFLDDIAKHFGGGGHPYAAGFKVYDTPYETIKQEFIGLIASHLPQ